MGEIIDDEPYEDPNQYWPPVDDSPDPLGDLIAAFSQIGRAVAPIGLVFSGTQKRVIEAFGKQQAEYGKKAIAPHGGSTWGGPMHYGHREDELEPEGRPKPVKSYGPRNGPAFTRRGRKNY